MCGKSNFYCGILIKSPKSGSISLMKNVYGVIIIASVVAVGTFSYFLLTNDKSAPETDYSQAIISKPVANLPATKNQTPENKEDATPTKEENKPLPELDSLNGLEEESGDLFEDIDGFLEGNAEDSLKDAIQ